MKKLLDKFKNGAFRILMRLFMPDLAIQMEQEGMFSTDCGGGAAGGTPEYLRVEDNGADLTIFAFSGLDVLYAGLARYEFQRVLHTLDMKANFVFVRDVHRIGFHLKPDGSDGGPAFYEAEIRKTMDALGASRNIAIGSSIGGSAAFYFSTACGMDQAIIFGAAFKIDSFTHPRMALRVLFDLKKLFTEPRAYFEMLIVTGSALWGSKRLVKRFGEENVIKPLEVYRGATEKPAITLFYGATAWPDSAQAQLLEEIGTGTRLVPLPTGRHNTPAFLKQRGELGAALAEALQQDAA